MKEKPILFSAPMVRAILAGNKTQTRRIVKPQPDTECEGVEIVCEHYNPTKTDRKGEEYPGPEVFGFADENSGWVCPYGAPGDRLWVRETFWCGLKPEIHERAAVAYRADYFPFDVTYKWKPSIYMPRWASRITLEVAAVRVERLQDISESDAMAEGIYSTVETDSDHVAPTECYKKLWESINGPGSWDANPWVWVVEFKRLP
jgi:hypothetical protein